MASGDSDTKAKWQGIRVSSRQACRSQDVEKEGFLLEPLIFSYRHIQKAVRFSKS